jgi:spore maturation protein CgeB
LFEAASCGTPILSDWWEGLDSFFTPAEEILVSRSADDTIAALSLSDAELNCIALRARERVLTEHTADRRAEELETLISKTVSAGLHGQGPAELGNVMEM